MTPAVQEFYNHVHSSRDGRFASGRSSGGSPASTTLRSGKPPRTDYRNSATTISGTNVATPTLSRSGGKHSTASVPRSNVTVKKAWLKGMTAKKWQSMTTAQRNKVDDGIREGRMPPKEYTRPTAAQAKANAAAMGRKVVVKDLIARSKAQSAKNLAEAKRRASLSANVEEFYNHVHDKSTGRFSGRAASGREGFREGSHGGAKSEANGFDPTRIVPKRLRGKGDRSTGHGEATPENFPRGDKRKGPVHSKTEVQQGSIHTSLKGSHTIRKTKSGGYVLHTKTTAPPTRITKSAADHVKALDNHKTTAADEIRARIQRWHAKD